MPRLGGSSGTNVEIRGHESGGGRDAKRAEGRSARSDEYVGAEFRGASVGVQRRRGRMLKPRDPGGRKMPAKVLKERRAPRRRGRTGTSVRRTHPTRGRASSQPPAATTTDRAHRAQISTCVASAAGVTGRRSRASAHAARTSLASSESSRVSPSSSPCVQSSSVSTHNALGSPTNEASTNLRADADAAPPGRPSPSSVAPSPLPP